MSKSKIKTYKKILYAGNGDPIEFKTDSKAVFHFEVFLPKIDVDIIEFPQEKLVILLNCKCIYYFIKKFLILYYLLFFCFEILSIN